MRIAFCITFLLFGLLGNAQQRGRDGWLYQLFHPKKSTSSAFRDSNRKRNFSQMVFPGTGSYIKGDKEMGAGYFFDPLGYQLAGNFNYAFTSKVIGELWGGYSTESMGGATINRWPLATGLKYHLHHINNTVLFSAGINYQLFFQRLRGMETQEEIPLIWHGPGVFVEAGINFSYDISLSGRAGKTLIVNDQASNQNLWMDQVGIVIRKRF